MRTLADKEASEIPTTKTNVIPLFRKVGLKDPRAEAERRKRHAEEMKRNGKTEKDHKSGSWKNRFVNQAARAEAQKGK